MEGMSAKAQIIELASQDRGFSSQEEIAAHLGVTRVYVSKVLKAAGVQFAGRPGPKRDQSKHDRLRALLESGECKTQAELADRAGIPRSTVRDMLKHDGVDIAWKPGRPRKDR